MSEQAVRTGVALVLLLVQLVAVAAVIAWIFSHPQWSAVYLALMVCAAAYTANHRIGGNARDAFTVLASIALGAATTVAIVVVTGAMDFTSQSLLQLSTFEGYVALGATYHQAAAPLARRATERTLLPEYDCAKTCRA